MKKKYYKGTIESLAVFTIQIYVLHFLKTIFKRLKSYSY